MKRVLFSLALFLACSSLSATAQVTDSVDVYTGDRYIYSDSMRAVQVQRFPGHMAGVKAYYTKKRREGNRWALTFYSYSEQGALLQNARQMYFVADGERVQPYDTERDLYRQQFGSRMYLVERQTGIFKRSVYETIAGADSVRVKMGEALLSLSKAAREDMQRILGQVSKY